MPDVTNRHRHDDGRSATEIKPIGESVFDDEVAKFKASHLVARKLRTSPKGNKPKTGMYQDADGSLAWYNNGVRNRTGGPAVIRPDNTQEWYVNGERHCEHGPAIVRADGSQEWYKHGIRHCEDGPAIIRADGSQEWYVDGRLCSQEEFKAYQADPFRFRYGNSRYRDDDGFPYSTPLPPIPPLHRY